MTGRKQPEYKKDPETKAQHDEGHPMNKEKCKQPDAHPPDPATELARVKQERDAALWRAEQLRGSSAYQVGTTLLSALRNPARGLFIILPGMFRAGMKALRRQKKAASIDSGPRPWAASSSRPGYLFFCVNGVGLGHLTRSLAVARRLRTLSPEAPIIFLSSSHAIHLITNQGFPCYYVPPKATFGNSEAADNWNALLRWTLQPIIDQHGPLHLVYDGVYPYAGLMNIIMEQAFTRTTMIMRMRHKGGIPAPVRDQLKKFDEIIIPGEAGEAGEQTKIMIPGLKCLPVDPVLYLDRDELLARDEARKRLGIPPDSKAIYLQLGAGILDDTQDALRASVEACLVREDTFMIVARSPIARADLDWVYNYPRARMLSQYPNALCFNAFDLAISATGYNTFHELMHYGLPALFIPNRQTSLDDQEGRARAAEKTGAALVVLDAMEIAPAIHRMLDDPGLAQRRERAMALVSANGAAQIARHLSKASEQIPALSGVTPTPPPPV